ncbi:hypothetical protein [Bradyrhizobium sp. PRIMUS42]|uniref:hypothetical protein n=1 Tax=Bradyrhizobium sp. PRIMUS42 TaxID=2908926 RepID=UPI001FF208FE|nr:hypothetical protein [Bradyrhizobium sp. PRIMUS42]MCJ9731746.1 hypothetical protein [Bradyrhizobium sp. PRIMUS42]
MTEPDRNGITARLWKLPGQLLLALINATAILVIVAAILALVAIARVDHLAENVVATMTEAVLSKVDLPAKDVLANLQKLTAEVRALRDAVGGGQDSRKSSTSNRDRATEGEADCSEYQRRAAQKHEIDPHRRSDCAIGADGYRRTDEAERLLLQRWPIGASPHPDK